MLPVAGYWLQVFRAAPRRRGVVKFWSPVAALELKEAKKTIKFNQQQSNKGTKKPSPLSLRGFVV
jgi:hypothetical protein